MDKSQNGGDQKTKQAHFPKSKHFLPPDMYTYENSREEMFYKVALLYLR